jgi:hypothetical protein
VWRSIRQGHWKDKNPELESDVNDAASDFILRNHEDYLSFFEVVDEDEGRRVAAVFKAISPGRPDKTDFMIFPRELLSSFGIELENKPDDSTVEFLSTRHLGTCGPNHTIDIAFIRMLMSFNGKRVVRIKQADLQQAIAREVEILPDLRERLGVHWRQLLEGNSPR